MAKSDVTEILELLNGDELKRLCSIRELPVGRTVSERRERLGKAYRGDVEELIEDLRVRDKIKVLQELILEGKDGGEYVFTGLHSARTAELSAALLATFSEWEPSGDVARPPRAGRIECVRWIDDDEREEEGDATLHDDSFDFDERDPIDEGEADPEEVDALPSREHIDPFASDPTGRPDAKLAEFQEEAVHALNERFAEPGARGLLCLPTGGGKTRTSLDWLLREHVARGKKIIWITHRLDLLDQVHEELRGLGWLLRESRPEGFTVSRYQGGSADVSGDVVLASAMTLASRMPSRRELGITGNDAIVVYDEAHRAIAEKTWKSIEKLLGEKRAANGCLPFLGLTATPFRLVKKETVALDDSLGAPVYQCTFKDLVDDGFLARPIFIRQELSSTKTFKLVASEIDEIERNRDFTWKVLRRLAISPERNAEIVSHWLSKRATYQKTLVFTMDIDHAELLAKMFRMRDIRAAALHSKMPAEERTRLLMAFRGGELDVLTNVGILTEGANIPDTRTVLLTRPTLSKSLYLQMIGRGARGPRTVPGKTHFHVVDCIDNFAIHGFTLAGAEVARELNTTEEPSRLAARRRGPTPRTPDEEQRVRQLATAATGWLLANDYDPRSYTLWGELRWGPEGEPRSIGVFTETLGLVEDAVGLIEQALRSGHWGPAHQQTAELESAGAMRALDWTQVVQGSEQLKQAPQLIPIPDVEVTLDDIRVAGIARELAAAVLHDFAAAMQASNDTWARDEAIQARWRSPHELWQEVLSTSSSQAAAKAKATAEAHAARSEPRPATDGLAAFIEVGLAIARADGVVAGSERLSIFRGSEQLFHGSGDVSSRAERNLDSFEHQSTLDVERALAALCSALDWPRRLIAFDLFFRVALADGILVDAETNLLERCARGLELPDDELTDRMRWFEPSTIATVETPLAGFRTCRTCSSTFDNSAKFCGYCGTSLGA